MSGIVVPPAWICRASGAESLRSRYDFKTEKSQRMIFKHTLIELGIRHRKAYNTRHTYATMLLMAGANIAFVAGQLGHSIIMPTSIYGEADRAEMAKLKTEIKNTPAEIRAPNNFLKSEKEKIGDISATLHRRTARQGLEKSTQALEYTI